MRQSGTRAHAARDGQSGLKRGGGKIGESVRNSVSAGNGVFLFEVEGCKFREPSAVAHAQCDPRLLAHQRRESVTVTDRVQQVRT